MNSSGAHEMLFVRNLELLPRGISIVRFHSAVQNRHFMGDEILLNEQQIRWIIDNLQGLESFWMSLLIPEQTNENGNNAAVQVAEGANNDHADEDEDGDVQPQLQQQVDANMLVNINLNTMRDLAAMPQLKDLRLDLMKAAALAEDIQEFEVQNRGLGTSLNDIQEYQNVFDAAEYKTTRTTSQGFGVNNIAGFATLTIQKNTE